MPLEIVLWPDPVLLEGTSPVIEVDDEIRAIVGGMRGVMFDLRGVGLAAPQVGVAKRIMLVCPTGEPGEEEVVINPKIVERDGEQLGDEGCLSFPEIYGKVRRAKTVVVEYQDIGLFRRSFTLTGFVARIFQHEMDHLDGKVFVDRMEPRSREKIEPMLEELRTRYQAATD